MNLTANQQIRVDIILKYINGDIYLDDALKVVQLSERQFRRILKAFREDGFESIQHGNSNKEPSNKISHLTYNMITSEYRTKYFDYNVSHFREKLIADPDIMGNYVVPSYQTIRRILIKEKLITHKVTKKKKAYKPRKRYEKEGLMIQIDGSHHHWLTKHTPFCLTAAIDDATGKLLAGHFTKTETTFAAMDVVREIVETKGCFQMLYSDKAGIYGGGKRVGYTNMDRAMKELGIIPVQASTPQAKGKIERLFKTLQDRLVSEMRLRGIRRIDEANKFLKEEFIDHYNEKFSREVESKAYKEVDSSLDLDEVFTMRSERVIGSGNLFSYEGRKFVVCKDECMAKKQVELRFYPAGNMKAFLMGERVDLEVWGEAELAA